MIRDRIVVGIRDTALSQKLQLDPDLTLEKAKTQVRQREAVQEHQQQMKGGFKTSSPVDAVPVRRYQQREQRNKTTKTYQHARSDRPGQSTSDKCPRCGKGSHPRQQCPARDAICHSCKKKGHYSACCLSKSPKSALKKSVRFSKEVDDVSEEEQFQEEFCDTVFLNTIDSSEDSG